MVESVYQQVKDEFLIMFHPLVLFLKEQSLECQEKLVGYLAQHYQLVTQEEYQQQVALVERLTQRCSDLEERLDLFVQKLD